MPANRDPVALAQPFARDRTGRDAHRRFAGRLPPAAAVIAEAVLVPVGVVGVARPEGLGNCGVIPASRVFVADQKRDRRAGGPSFEHARQNFDAVGLAALGDMSRGSGLAPVEVALDVGLGQREPGRAAVDHASDRGSVRFAERCHAVKRAEGVAGHDEAAAREVSATIALGPEGRSAPQRSSRCTRRASRTHPRRSFPAREADRGRASLSSRRLSARRREARGRSPAASRAWRPRARVGVRRRTRSGPGRH